MTTYYPPQNDYDYIQLDTPLEYVIETDTVYQSFGDDVSMAYDTRDIDGNIVLVGHSTPDGMCSGLSRLVQHFTACYPPDTKIRIITCYPVKQRYIYSGCKNIEFLGDWLEPGIHWIAKDQKNRAYLAYAPISKCKVVTQ